MQIAVQHDHVIATTIQGHRLVLPLKDSKFPMLLADAMRSDGSMPFEVLPMDPFRAKVRDAAFTAMIFMGTFYAADEFDLLPFELSSYNSLKELEEAKEARARGEAPKRLKTLGKLKAALEKYDAMKARTGKGKTAKRRTKSATGAPGVMASQRLPTEGGSVGKDEALKRVLGLTKWDAAAELRAKVLESPAHKNIVAAKDEMKDAVLESATHQRIVKEHNRL